MSTETRQLHTAPHDRTSKYIEAVRVCMHGLGHFTNAELLEVLRHTYPEVSATTVHRITARMVERGELQFAPAGRENVKRFDTNLAPHDHFCCESCGMLRDAELRARILPLVEEALGEDCAISGSLTISGICKQCHKEATL